MNGNGDVKHHGTMPRWFLGLALVVAAWGAARWVDRVEQHINESTRGYQGIAIIETRQDNLKARIEQLEARVEACERWHRSAESR